jgi:DNA modification methylase
MIITGDAREVLKTLPDKSVHCCVTSPPYWGLRDYGVDGQLGLEETPEEYVERLVQVFREVRRVLRDDGTLWLNLGDSYYRSWGNYAPTGKGGQREKHTERFDRRAYAGKVDWRPPTSYKHEQLKPKDLVGIPWRVAFALQADGWYLRSDIIWHKPNPMPESVTDRPTKAHEYIFLLSKSERYYYDADAIREPHKTNLPVVDKHKAGAYTDKHLDNQEADPFGSVGYHPKGRNKRTVWTVSTKPFSGTHFATFPEELIEPCILAGCPVGGTVLDPFFGAGTTGLVAVKLDRKYIGIELNPEYVKLAKERLRPVESQARLALWV